MRGQLAPAQRSLLALTAFLLAVGLWAPWQAFANGSVRFVDVAVEQGIEAWISHGGPGKEWIAEANGSGAAALDYDGDGWMDILIVSGASVPDLRPIASGKTAAGTEQRVHLYRNLGGTGFEEVAGDAGLSCPYWCTGANASDYDGDGDTDVFITSIGLDLLYRNDGDGTFTEVGSGAGLSRTPAWHAGSSFGDIDGDGDLDLYVAAYLDLGRLPMDGDAPVCDYHGLGVFCGPKRLEPGSDVLYRNNGDGTFTDISQASGIRSAGPSPGFTPVIEDFDQDGRADIFVANDSAPNFLFLNAGGGEFKNGALIAGLAYNAAGDVQADMGAAVADYDADGDLDILTTTFSEDYFPLFVQQAPGYFEESSFRVGLGTDTVPYLGWGCGFADLDNDADLDLWTANGHVYPIAGDLGTTAYRQPLTVWQLRDGRLVADRDATAADASRSYRGAASLDFDNDGRIDLLALPVDGRPVLLRNESRSAGAWLGLRLKARSDGEATHARVTVEHCGTRQVRLVRNGGSYASRSDPRVHFGLGDCEQASSVTVRWPSGRVDEIGAVPAGQWMSLEERP